MCFVMETAPLDKPTPPCASFHGEQHGHVKEYIAAIDEQDKTHQQNV